jgi:hypothetical protein
MRRAAEIAALVFTARDAMVRDTPEDLRIAFLLFDSAIETLMVRRLDGLGAWSWYSDVPSWVPVEQVKSIDLEDFGQRAREEAATEGYIWWSASASMKRKIEHEFGAKLKALAWQGYIDANLVGIAERLHDYRNEMYHREETRPQALRVAAHLYALVVTLLLRSLRPGYVSFGADAEEVRLRIEARLSTPTARRSRMSLSAGNEIQEVLADDLLAACDLQDAGSVIAEYIDDRTQGLHGLLEFIRGFVEAYDQSVEQVSEMDVVRLIFLMDSGESLKNLRSQAVPITRRKMREWDEWGNGISADSAPLEAFASLALFEKEFEDFERRVRDVARQVDEAIDAEIDRRRGK